MKKSVSKSKGKKNQKNQKDQKGFILLLSLVCFIGLGIGYAALTQTLNITNKVQFGAMSWDVKFENGVQHPESTVTTTVDPVVDGVQITCELGKKTASQTCVATVDINNDSAFPIILKQLSTTGLVDDAQNYIESVQYTWASVTEGVTYAVGSALEVDQVIPSKGKNTIKIVITTKTLDENSLPTQNLIFTINSMFEWVEHTA